MQHWIKGTGEWSRLHTFSDYKKHQNHIICLYHECVKYFLSKSRTLEIILITANFDSYKDIITHMLQFWQFYFCALLLKIGYKTVIKSNSRSLPGSRRELVSMWFQISTNPIRWFFEYVLLVRWKLVLVKDFPQNSYAVFDIGWLFKSR